VPGFVWREGQDISLVMAFGHRCPLEAHDNVLRLSETFPDPVKLLAAAEEQGLEGIVSKLTSQPYRSGKNPGWVKVKCRAWREGNKDRWELFENR
jgi:hypothetical protein